MTPTKTARMKEVIREIQKLNPTIKALTYNDFMNTEAKELLLDPDDDNSILKRNELLYKIAQVPMDKLDILFPSIDSTKVSNFNNTAKFFGIDETMKSLIQKLSSDVYTDININERQIKDGIIDSYIHQGIKKDFEEWIQLCKKLDGFKIYFESLDKKKQTQLKEGMKILNQAPFIENSNVIKIFYSFTQRHRLSQLNKFKVEKLLSLNLPNVNTEELAKDIHKSTKLRHL